MWEIKYFYQTKEYLEKFRKKIPRDCEKSRNLDLFKRWISRSLKMINQTSLWSSFQTHSNISVILTYSVRLIVTSNNKPSWSVQPNSNRITYIYSPITVFVFWDWFMPGKSFIFYGQNQFLGQFYRMLQNIFGHWYLSVFDSIDWLIHHKTIIDWRSHSQSNAVWICISQSNYWKIAPIYNIRLVWRDRSPFRVVY